MLGKRKGTFTKKCLNCENKRQRQQQPKERDYKNRNQP